MYNKNEVSYGTMAQDLNRVKSQANEINNNLLNAFKIIDSMRGDWYGKRYDELVDQINGVIPEINSILDGVVDAIPFTLAKSLNRYSNINKDGNITSTQPDLPKNIQTLTKTNKDEKMRFEKQEVEDKMKQVSDEFSNAISNLQNLGATISSLSWVSEAGDAYKQAVDNLSKRMKTSFDTLNSQMSAMVKTATTEIGIAENQIAEETVSTEINIVDYADLSEKAKEIRAIGQNINSEYIEIYQELDEIHADWYGVRYNALVTKFNELLDDINKMLRLVVTELPFELENKANNYSQANTGTNITNAHEADIDAIQEIELASDTGLRFITESVESMKSSIMSHFESINDNLNEILERFKSITWDSKAEAKRLDETIELINRLEATTDTINREFETNMNQALADMDEYNNLSNVDNQ